MCSVNFWFPIPALFLTVCSRTFARICVAGKGLNRPIGAGRGAGGRRAVRCTQHEIQPIEVGAGVGGRLAFLSARNSTY